MKIGVVCYPTYGGSGVVATELGMELANRGHDVHFVSYQPPARFSCATDKLHFHEVEISSYPVFKHPPYLLAAASKLAEVIETFELDLLHVHYAIPHAISACLAREIIGRKDLPIVTTLHGTDITVVGKEPAYFRVVQFALRDSDAVTAVSHSLAEETRKTFAHEGEVEVIHNFVDASRFRPDSPCEFRDHFASPEEKILVHISNYRPVKNAPDVVKVFASVVKTIPARLVLVGDGPELGAVRTTAKELGVLDGIRFQGETPEVARVLACADLFLLPSSKESFGLAALEAMAAGVPVVASRVGGVPEVVTHGESGMLVEVHDIESMAKAARELLGDSKRLGAMRESARRRAVEHFSPKEIIPRYEALYERLLARR
ncbi:MAG: N-acetyl-alpha-D-glucosaminyl L-malate synthase BshA [Planctomycetota bacterium]|jgi:N-acetyl-alpha-D-glucosaminyl L-malate synthase BshA